jgi:hypothetical protein
MAEQQPKQQNNNPSSTSAPHSLQRVYRDVVDTARVDDRLHPQVGDHRPPGRRKRTDKSYNGGIETTLGLVRTVGRSHPVTGSCQTILIY